MPAPQALKPASAPKAPASIVRVTAGQVLRHMDLLRLNFGVFCLHFILMSLFIVL
ncbi:transport protein [Alcaligenes faecalis subsp. faecalis NCIB 8687]|nr:transport protein [Alcaligenes faecalis subsp. faecalis NCIB 8687]